MSSKNLATVPQLLTATLTDRASQPALGLIHSGKLTWLTWEEVSTEVKRFALALISGGIGQGDRVAQISENRAEWIFVDLAILTIGAVHVPLHSSQSADQLAEQLSDCGAKLIFVSENGQEKVTQSLDSTIPIVTYDPLPSTNQWSGGFRHGDQGTAIETIAEFLADTSPNNPQSAIRNPQSNDLATLLYTSGTTGRPRGVMLSHGNLVSNSIATAEAVGDGSAETRLCFLPLSHVYARTCDLYTWIIHGSRLVLAESRETIFRDCQIAQPTALNGVPYFYQKVAQQVCAAGKQRTPGAVRQLLGGKLKRCFCGGAAVAPEVESFFFAQELPLLSGYGQTEASPVITAASMENYRPGTVGQPVPGTEVRISEGGEILTRGPNVMLGYWHDEEATRSTIVDGWLHTGDLGELDSEGNLRIIGRRKELIVLSTGKNISPSRVEQLLTGSTLIEAVCVVGEGRKCLAALIVPNPAALCTYIRQEKLWVWSRRRGVTHPRVRQLYRQEIDQLLTGASREEQVGMFTILQRAFCQERGEQTPKMSLRREIIDRNFRSQIEAMYRRGGGFQLQ